jgi:hypothetical protein
MSRVLVEVTSMGDVGRRESQADAGDEAVKRWECRCREPAVLLGTIERNSRVNIKVRDRYWHVEGIIRTTCPRCGVEHVLDLRAERHTGRQAAVVAGLA